MKELPKNYHHLGLEQDTPEWHAWRRGGFGSSDMAALLGMGIGKPGEVIASKWGAAESRPNMKMLRGKQLEPAARNLYMCCTKKTVKPVCLEHVFFAWARASLDGFNVQSHYAVEIKAGKAAYQKASKGIIPEYYQCQLQHIMFVAALGEIDYWCCNPDNLDEHILIKVDRDEEFIQNKLIPAGDAFSQQLPQAL